ncbi:hypothetical protein [[Clostridium] fimetarium]|uniref:Uncharacterized protein n=1 Tax=[Clostridium] fimetarium TaxID=99656 RepID=A0A1I0Q0Y6_9FIRM|nr:hypothetical protein [[Clostridium] fimetarium]SEW20572.1 hypothetical protein SAMN05421659_106207 [[Clostridium] fimetarium]
MVDKKHTNLSFNMSNAEHDKAWNYLHSMDKKKFGSQNKLIIKAINDYFDNYYVSKNDPYLESRIKEDDFINRIISEVGFKLTEQMPQMVSGYLMNMLGPMMCNSNNNLSSNSFSIGNKGAPSEAIDNSETEDDLDWNFIDGFEEVLE